jgi:hypothetical protein
MVKFERFQLSNGLKVIFHKDKSTPMAVVNVLYDIGARDESEEKTGFAHLFEHLMFGGSVNIPHFDTELQKAGGENNAFTSNDITNYYDVLPANNLDTVLWLESDRMLSLAFTEKSLEVQKVIEIAQKAWPEMFQVSVQNSQETKYEAFSLELDSKRSNVKLGWTPAWSQSEAITETVTWWKNLIINDKSPIELCNLNINKAIMHHGL